jgi:hypothetical protein
MFQACKWDEGRLTGHKRLPNFEGKVCIHFILLENKLNVLQIAPGAFTCFELILFHYLDTFSTFSICSTYLLEMSMETAFPRTTPWKRGKGKMNVSRLRFHSFMTMIFSEHTLNTFTICTFFAFLILEMPIWNCMPQNSATRASFFAKLRRDDALSNWY